MRRPGESRSAKKRMLIIDDALRATCPMIEERGPLTEDGDITGMLAMCDEFIAEGEQYEHNW